MSLRDEVKCLSGNRRKFFLLRVADVDTNMAKNLCHVKQGTYNSWVQNAEFVALYRQRDEFCALYKQEAIQMLRRDNQLEAVMLEGKILTKMKEELDSGEYNLIRLYSPESSSSFILVSILPSSITASSWLSLRSIWMASCL